MKETIVAILIILSIGCNQQDNKKQENTPVVDTTDSVARNSKLKTDSIGQQSNDTALLQLSNEILAAIKVKNYPRLASFAHPSTGIRFSPYAFVDTVVHQRILPAQLINISKQKKILVWGIHDGSGEPIKKSINNYFDEFVYDADFIKAPQQAVNKILASGNSLNNLKVIYPIADFTEFYFPGFDPKYGGMDWKTLRLVFQTENNKPWLIAIVHDEWTI